MSTLKSTVSNICCFISSPSDTNIVLKLLWFWIIFLNACSTFSLSNKASTNMAPGVLYTKLLLPIILHA